jgi:UDP-N-acetylmuramoyl-tripeptide--D-alanyl-D-alanine ligase
LASPLLGAAGALAVAAALAVVEGLMGEPLLESELRHAVTALPAAGPGRLFSVQLADHTLLIDDSYNANPASMRASIATAAELAVSLSRRLVLVLGEMRELGALAKEEHAALGRVVAESGAHGVVGVAGDAELVVVEARRAGISAAFAPDAERALALVLDRTKPGDVVLVKGSRSVGTDRIVKALESARGLAAEQRNRS